MMQALLLFAWCWPLLLAISLLPRLSDTGDGAGGAMRPDGEKRPGWRASLILLAPLPALVAGMLVPPGLSFSLPWLFLGTELGQDHLSRLFLLFTSIIWLAAGIYSVQTRPREQSGWRWEAFFLLAMAGNLWLIVGQDLLSFYAGFAMMGLASYGLVIQEGHAVSRRAGRVYLTMTLLGEVALFAAFVLIAQQTGSAAPSGTLLAQLDALAVALLILGLAVKAGLVPLHLWLPPAYSAAPTAASAVLSGAMINVALLGWLRYLPLGVAELPGLGAVFAAMGLLSLFYALPVGLVQSDPKALLGYSSISKMGLVSVMLGLILMSPMLAPVGISALTLFAAHHALVKSGLFLGVGLRRRGARSSWQSVLVVIGIALLSLALISAPFTSGAVTKYAMKPLVEAAGWPWLGAALLVAAIATTLLMARFFWIVTQISSHWSGRSLGAATLAWSLMVLIVLAFPFVLGSSKGWMTNLAPTVIGLTGAGLVALAALANPSWLRPLIGLIPPGDLLVLAAPSSDLARKGGRALATPWQRLGMRLQGAALHAASSYFRDQPADPERRLRAWPVAGAVWIGITVLLAIALLAGLALASTDRQTEHTGPSGALAGPPTIASSDSAASRP